MPARTLAARRAPAHRPGLISRLLALMSVRSSRARLAELDGRMLRDIGLTQEQARAEAERPFWDAPVGWRR